MKEDHRLKVLEPTTEQKISTISDGFGDVLVNIATLGGISAAKRIARKILKQKEKRWEELAGLTLNEKSEEYGICFGYAVKNHTEKEYTKDQYATQRDGYVGNVIAPILLNDDVLRQHVQIIGTTGSGKTQLLKGVLEQQIARGGGAFAVFGKADNVMLQQLYSVAVEYGREQDFYVVDWTATKEQARDSLKMSNKPILTNAINLFDLGSVDDVINAMIRITGLDKNSDKWGDAAKDYLSAVLRLLAALKDADLMFDIDKLQDILLAADPLEMMLRNKEELSFYALSEIITSTEKTFMLLTLIDRLYCEKRGKFESLLHRVNDDGEILYADSSRRDDIHRQLRQTLDTQINGITANAIIRTIESDPVHGFANTPKTDKTFYKLEISQSQLGNLISFYEKFALVLKNRKSDFDFVEAFRSGKVVIFNVPGQESEDAKVIGKMVMAVLNLLVKKQGKAPQTGQTFLGIFDEVNSWAKGSQENVFGLGDILSVVRGLGIAGIVAHQSSLDSMGKGTSEREQIQANINTKFVLKTESAEIIRELNELVGKKEVKYLRDKIKHEKSQTDTDTEIVQEDYFTKETLGSLWAGQGYIIRNHVISKMITYYLPNKRYSDIDEETIPIIKTIDIDTLRKAINESA